jgi:prophage antirepressor-like protein
MRTENWCGYDIRFVEINGEWWAILKDICDALKLRTAKIAERLSPDMLERVLVEASNVPSKDLRYEHQPVKNINAAAIGKDIGRRPGDNKTRWMLAVNELGIYEALFASRRLEARKFRMWAGTVMQKLRSRVGLQQYEVMRMTEPEIQDEIDDILDTLFWDEEKGCLMQSVTVPGGDVDQVPFE